MLFVFILLLSIVCVEAITEIVIKSLVFKRIRDFFEGKNIPILSKILTCPYCFSVWASALVCSCIFFGPIKVFPEVLNTLVFLPFYVLFTHRMSNYLHFIVDRIDKFYQKERSL